MKKHETLFETTLECPRCKGQKKTRGEFMVIAEDIPGCKLCHAPLKGIKWKRVKGNEGNYC